MHEQLMGTYRDLMGSLAALPDNIAAEQERLEGQQREVQAIGRALETTEHAYIAAEGGWKSLGSNDKERELHLAEFRRSDRAMRDLSAQERSARFAVEETQRVVNGLERRYGAVCYQAWLHAALLNYLGAAGAPCNCAQLPGALPAVPSAPVNGAAYNGARDVSFYPNEVKGVGVSLTDATAIGL